MDLPNRDDEFGEWESAVVYYITIRSVLINLSQNGPFSVCKKEIWLTEVIPGVGQKKPIFETIWYSSMVRMVSWIAYQRRYKNKKRLKWCIFDRILSIMWQFDLILNKMQNFFMETKIPYPSP